MSFFTRYCRKCGQPIHDGSDGHVFRCPPKPRPLTWPPEEKELVELRRLAEAGNDNAAQMLALHEKGVMASPAAIDWYIDHWKGTET